MENVEGRDAPLQPLSLMQRVGNLHLYGCEATEPPYGRACTCGVWAKLRLEIVAALSEKLPSIGTCRQCGYTILKNDAAPQARTGENPLVGQADRLSNAGSPAGAAPCVVVTRQQASEVLSHYMELVEKYPSLPLGTRIAQTLDHFTPRERR